MEQWDVKWSQEYFLKELQSAWGITVLSSWGLFPFLQQMGGEQKPEYELQSSENTTQVSEKSQQSVEVPSSFSRSNNQQPTTVKKRAQAQRYLPC